MLKKSGLNLLTPHSMQFLVNDVISNPISNTSEWSGPGTLSPDPGVQLIVDGGVPTSGYVNGAQMNSAREDLRYGSYRALMKLPSTSGTCSAFFWVGLISSTIWFLNAEK